MPAAPTHQTRIVGPDPQPSAPGGGSPERRDGLPAGSTHPGAGLPIDRWFDWPDEAATASAASALAARPALREATLELRGPLGAGKTTFVRHLLRALGVEGRIKSPSYAVVEPYVLAGGSEAWHFDFYRFADPREFEDAGLRELYAAPGLKVSEWPEHVGSALPAPDLRIALEVNGRARRARFEACTPRGLALLPA